MMNKEQKEIEVIESAEFYFRIIRKKKSERIEYSKRNMNIITKAIRKAMKETFGDLFKIELQDNEWVEVNYLDYLKKNDIIINLPDFRNR